MPIENIKDEVFRSFCKEIAERKDANSANDLFKFLATHDVIESDFIEMINETRVMERISSLNPQNFDTIAILWFSKNLDCSQETFDRLRPHIEKMDEVVEFIIGTNSSQEQLIKFLGNPREGLKFNIDTVANGWLSKHANDNQSFQTILLTAAIRKVHQIDDPEMRYQSFLETAKNLKIISTPSQIFVDEMCRSPYFTGAADLKPSPKISAQEFVDHILKSEVFGLISVGAREEMVTQWVEENPNCPNEDLLLIATNLRFPEADQTRAIVKMAKSIGDDSARYNFFLDAVKNQLIAPKGTNRHESIVTLYYDLELPIERISKICLSLEETSEGERLNLFNKFIDKKPDLPITSLAKALIGTFSQDNIIELLLDKPSVKEAAARENTTNELYQTWGQSRKKFLFALVGGDEFKLEDVLTEESLEAVKASRGEDSKDIDLATLIFRRSRKKNHEPKLSFSQPIAELMGQRLPSLSTTSYCTEDEMELIQREIGALPSNIGVNNITSYLKPHITEAPSLTPEEANSYEINFTDSAVLTENRAAVNEKFRKALRLNSNNPYSEEYRRAVVDFYEAAIGHEINRSEENKLASNFASNRDKIAHLFSQDGEFDKYIGSCVGKSSDGCVANIGTKAEVALTESLVKDPYARIIYSAFANKLCFQLLNSGNKDNLGSSPDGAKIFENEAITSAHLIPAGFITAVKNEFLGEKGRMRDPWNYIKKALGENHTQILEGILSEKSEEIEEIESGPVAKLREEIKKLKAQLPQDEISEINKKILDRTTRPEEKAELRKRKDEIQKMRQEDPKSAENLANTEQETKIINEQIQQLQDKIGNIKSAIVEEEAAKIATYITLQMSLPRLLDGSKIKTEVEETFKHPSFNPPITIIPATSKELSPPKPIISNRNHGPTFLSDINSTFVPTATLVPTADPVFNSQSERPTVEPSTNPIFNRPFVRPTNEPTAYNPTPTEVEERPSTINVLGRPGSVSLRQLAERDRGGRNNDGSGNSGRFE